MISLLDIAIANGWARRIHHPRQRKPRQPKPPKPTRRKQTKVQRRSIHRDYMRYKREMWWRNAVDKAMGRVMTEPEWMI